MSNIDNKEVEGIEIKKYNQFRYDFEDYMIKYVIPDVVAHQLAQAYYRGCLSKISLKRHYTCMSDVFNIFNQMMYPYYYIIHLLFFFVKKVTK